MTIRVTEIVETEWGEKAILDAPFETKDYIKVLPWGDGEYGEAGVPQTENVSDQAAEAAQDFDWPDDYESHVSWNGDNWTLDPDALGEAMDFWQAQGFNVEVAASVAL